MLYVRRFNRVFYLFRKMVTFRISVVFLVFISCCFIPASYAEKVRYAIDGDTIVLENNQRVRLIGIDAPEIENRKYGREGEYYGEEAKQFLKQLIEGKDVRLEDGYEPFDKYGRGLAYVYLGDLFVNAELVRLGYAEVFRIFDFEYKDQFLELERQARSQGLGIWAEGTMAPGVTVGNKDRWSEVAIGVLLVIFVGFSLRRKFKFK